jgi:hypothetical protein
MLTLVIVVAISRGAFPAEDDPILDFYCSSAGANFEGRNPLTHGATFRFRATSILSTFAGGGVAYVTDSTVSDYYYSFGQSDSTCTIVSSQGKMPAFEFAAPNVFGDSLIHSFFPNDTGGAELPIGFDSPLAESGAPNGIAVIDRSTYATKRLYLFYPNKVGYKRLSRIYNFTMRDEYLFPESIVEQGAISGIFTTSYYRMETRLTAIQLIRQPIPVGH